MKCPERAAEFVGINGYAAKNLGKQVKLRNGWKYMDLQVMEMVVTAKFTQNPDLMQKLKQTSGVLEETNTWGDTYWGICNGIGQNHLGLILTKPNKRDYYNKLEKNKKTKHTEPIVIAGNWEKVESNPDYQAQCTIISTRQIYFPK